MAIDLERVLLVKKVARLVSNLSLGDANLLMRQANLFDIPMSQWGETDSVNFGAQSSARQDYLKLVFSDISAELLVELQEAALRIGETELTHEKSSFSVAPLRLFASHVSEEKTIVQEVAGLLKSDGIHMFVAHESIDVSSDWQLEIEKNLGSCHGAVAFIHSRFSESDWCHQEMGWVRGRGAPFLLVLFEGNLPKGMLAKTHGLKINGTPKPEQIAEDIVQWLSKLEELSPQLEASVISAFCNSGSFKATDRLWAKLKKIENLTDEQISDLLDAVQSNSQIYGATCRTNRSASDYGQPYTDLVIRFIATKPGFTRHLERAKSVARENGSKLDVGLINVPF